MRSVRRVLDEEPMPLRIVRNYPPYREIADPREGRAAIVELQALRLEREGHSLLPGGPQGHRLPGPEEVEGRGVRGPRGPLAREAAGREEGGLRRRGGDPQAGQEPRSRRVPGPRRTLADGLRPLPRHLRQDPRRRCASSTATRSPRAGADRRGRCRSPPPGATRSGAPTSGTWTWSTRASSAARRTR